MTRRFAVKFLYRKRSRLDINVQQSFFGISRVCIMSTEAWFLPALMALCIWGVTVFLPKIILRDMKPLHMIVFGNFFFLGTAIVVLALYGFDLQFTAKGFGLALISGICGALGQIFYLRALKHGPVSYVVLVSALYPVVATLLAFTVLREPLSARQACGVAMGLCAIVMLVTAKDETLPAMEAADDRPA